MERGSIYPSWRFHADGRSVLCQDAAQDAALGDAWADSPAAFVTAPEAPSAEPEPAEPEDAPKTRRRKAKAE